MNKNWHGLIKIIEIQHLSKDGEIIWEDHDLYNVLHATGEQFILSAVFAGGQTNSVIPSSYYFGLDNRTSLLAADTMSTIASNNSEPTTNGYVRQAVSSDSEFVVTQVSNVNRATSPIVTFTATGGSWGPISNLFLTDALAFGGFLIASVPLSTALTVSSGESINMRMALALRDCPSS